MSNQHSHFDVCVICAMAEEAEGFLSQLTHYNPIRSAFSQRQREYRYTTIPNAQGEELAIQVSWLPRYGPLETGLHLDAILNEFQPRFVAMTGICAGDRDQVKLGDLVVAERAFFYDSGKFIDDDQGQQIHLLDTYTAQPSNDVLQFVRMFKGWEPAVSTLERPPSKRQQREWLLNELFTGTVARVGDIPLQELQTHAPAWRKIVRELQAKPDGMLTSERTLRDRDRISEMHYQDVFPFKDAQRPVVHIAPMGSGHAVRADHPFEEVRVPVRGTIAIDMEGASFYHTAANFPAIPSLLVKGVCDYADNDKDDSYHQYAATASALYLLALIKEYVRSERNLQASERKTSQENDAQSPPSSRVTNTIGSITGETIHVSQGDNVTIHHSH